MKPTLQILRRNPRGDSPISCGTGYALPKTDYQFRLNSTADFYGHCQGSPGPSFRGISEDYFKKEARGHFLTEAAVFVLMGITAAVPVIQGARGAANILAAYGLL
ncbi:MAG: hypothetical protein H0X73_08945 [Chthoniobacterales bacterium]|nr:hypothetical protein [Chthoniobacterales bacterium]